MDNNKSCPFCKNRIPLIQGEYCLSFFDEYPVSEGHTLVIPKRHINKMDELTSDEVTHSILPCGVWQGRNRCG